MNALVARESVFVAKAEERGRLQSHKTLTSRYTTNASHHFTAQRLREGESRPAGRQTDRQAVVVVVRVQSDGFIGVNALHLAWKLRQAEIERDTLGLVTIERDEYKTLKTRRDAAAKGRSLLSQLVSLYVRLQDSQPLQALLWGSVTGEPCNQNRI